MKPTIRVVIPTLGTRDDWLRLSLRAASAQLDGVEILVVGPDLLHIREAASEFGARFEVETGRTLSAAINQGASSTGSYDYLTWIADDDVLSPHSLAESLRALEHSKGAPFSFGRVRYIDADGRSKWLLRTGTWAVWWARIGVNLIPQPGSLIRRSSWEAIGGLDEQLRNAMDHDLFLRLAELSKPVYVPHEVASFRVHPGSISVQKSSQSESDQIRRRYANPRVLVMLAPLVNRVLLSTLTRIPGPRVPRVNGLAYTEVAIP